MGEDGHAASFAGQYETYLGVSGADEVLRHIAKCWASGYSAHALDYRRRFGGSSPLRAHDLAVGVLELVDARSAGVAFTLDPVTGDRGRLVVEANWGLGESVVSGQVTPDYWTVERDSGRIVERRVGAKLVWSVLADSSAADPARPRRATPTMTVTAARVRSARRGRIAVAPCSRRCRPSWRRRPA